MTLEMRDRENQKIGEIYGIIKVCRKNNFSEESIMKLLQEKKELSEESAKMYLEEAEEAIKRIDKYSAFIKSLCEIISDSKKINAGDDTIISKIQDKFHFDKDDAEFYYDYALKTHKDKITDSNEEKPEEVKEAKKDREWNRESMALLMRDRENRKIGEKLGKIHEAISMGKDYNIPESEILIRLQTKFDLTEEQARAYMEEAE